MTDFETIDLSRHGDFARVTLSRPDARNAVSLQMCLELRACFEQLTAEGHLRAVSVCGAGPLFCAGADLKERKGKDEAWVRKRRMASFAAYRCIEQCPVPVFALVHGPVIGAGGEMALATDFIIAADDASFKFPEPQWGTVGATQRLQRAIGKRGAKELLFTGRAMFAAEAQQRGLVQRIVAPENLAETGVEIEAEIAKAPPLAIRLTKQSIDLGGATDQDTGLRIELAAINHNFSAGEWRQGQDAFTESMQAKKASKNKTSDQ